MLNPWSPFVKTAYRCCCNAQPRYDIAPVTFVNKQAHLCSTKHVFKTAQLGGKLMIIRSAS